MSQPTALFSDTFDLPLTDIHADPARFQGRLGEYSEDTVNAIVAKGHYDRSKSPITVWRDPVNGKFYILSGHSRFEAAKRIYASGKQPELASLPVKQMMVDDVTAAIEYAVLESNRKSTEEGLVPDIMAYRKAVELGKNSAYLKSIFRPDSRFQRLKELSKLNPKGMFIEQLAAASQHSFPYLERNARWVGNMRAQFPALTDLHERELFDYLYGSKKALNITKQQFFDLVNSKVSRIDFDPANALNLANRISPTAYTDPLNEQLREIDKKIEAAQKEIERHRTTIARAKSEGIEPPMYQGRISFDAQIGMLNGYIIRKMEEKATVQQNAGRLERTMGGDLFSQVEEKPKAPDNILSSAQGPVDFQRIVRVEDTPFGVFPVVRITMDELKKGKSATSRDFHVSTAAPWYSVSGIDFKADYISESGSEYMYSDTHCYRRSNHWGYFISSCVWPLNGGMYDKMAIGACRWEDFYKLIDTRFPKSHEAKRAAEIVGSALTDGARWHLVKPFVDESKVERIEMEIETVAPEFEGKRPVESKQRKAGVHEIQKVITELVGETPDPLPVPVVEKVAQPAPIRTLGTGDAVYYDSFPHYRVNDSMSGKVYLNVGADYMLVPAKTLEYDTAKEAVEMAKKFEARWPKGVPEGLDVVKAAQQMAQEETILDIDEKMEDRKVSSFSTHVTPHPRFSTLYVASYPDRVSKQQFDADLARAKKLGGWYSSYNKNGAVAGFQFKTEKALQDFTGLMAPLEPSAPQAPKNEALAAPGKDWTLPYGEIPYFNFDASYDKLYNINGLTPTEELVAMGILRLVEWDKVYNRFNKKVGKLKSDKYDKIGIYDSYIKDYNNQNRKGIVGLATDVAGRMVKSHVAILNVSPLDVEWAKNKHAEAAREKHGPELRAAAKALAGEATYAFEVGDRVTFRDKPWEVLEKRGDGLTGPRYIIRELGTVRELGVHEKEISAAIMKPESNEIEYTVTVKDFEMPSRQEYKPTKQSDRREHPMIQVGNLVDRMFKGIGPIWPMMRRGSEWLYDTQGMKPKRVVINVFWVNNHTVRVNWIVQQKTYGRPFKYMANGQVSTGTKAIYRHSYDDDGITVNVGEPLQVNTGDTILYGYSQDTSGTGKVTEVYFDPLGRAYDVRVKRKAGDYINVNVQDITLVVAEQPKKANEKIISLEPMNKIVQRSPIQAINGLALFTSSAGKFVVMGKEIQKVSTNYDKDFIMDGAKPNAVFWLAQNIKMYPQERMFTNPADAQRVPLNKIYSTKENKESSFIVAAAKMMEAAHGNGEPRGPITVEKMPDGRYHVKDGNATFEVAKRSGWDYIPAIVVNEQPTQITDPKRKRMLMMAKAAAARARALELK